MKARRFKASDKAMIDSWYESRKMPPIPWYLLPETGFIVDDMAAGFLYLSDGGIAFIENFITPEGIHFQDRSDALDLVAEALVEEAKALGVKKVLALTQAQAIYNRAIKMGFDDIGNYRVLSKDLNDFGKIKR